MLVYMLRNTVNGKYYIGKTKRQLSVRVKEHFEGSNTCGLIERALKKYTSAAFEVHILGHASTSAELNNLESLWIVSLRSYDTAIGYNLTYGGDGVKSTEETKQKISIANKGRKQSLQEIEKRRKSITLMWQKKLAAGFVRKAKGKPGRQWTTEQKIAKRIERTGTKRSKESILKQAAAMKIIKAKEKACGKIFTLPTCLIESNLKRKNKHYQEIFGLERATEIIAKISKGVKIGRYGK